MEIKMVIAFCFFLGVILFAAGFYAGIIAFSIWHDRQMKSIFGTLSE